MFKYLELATETYDNKRWYHTEKGAYPSITTVLGHTASQEKINILNKWRESFGHEKADEYTKSRAAHGTMVHLLAERYLNGEDLFVPVGGQEIPEYDIRAFKALKLKLNKIQKIWGQEVALVSSKLEVAGRCDLIGIYNDKPVIIDFKTSARIKNDADIEDYKLQLCFYAIAHNEMFNTQITDGVIMMVANGLPLEFNVYLPTFAEMLQKRVNLFWKNTINNL